MRRLLPKQRVQIQFEILGTAVLQVQEVELSDRRLPIPAREETLISVLYLKQRFPRQLLLVPSVVLEDAKHPGRLPRQGTDETPEKLCRIARVACEQ